ncbi:MAG: cell wall hydrolase [Sphingomonadaceae bacterium]|nr:cell wall hydrolase [Sphingomonadaceae bacterium]
MAKPEGSHLARWPVFASLLSLASCFALSGTAGPVKPLDSSLANGVRIPLGALAAGSEPAVMTFQPVDAEKAFEMNAAVPNDSGPILSATPFRAAFGDEGIGARMTALECLASAIYYEAGSESSVGQRAVAQVVLNRVRHPAYPHSVCGVVFQGSERTTGCQFTFTCDGSLARPRNPQVWSRAMSVAAAALAGYVERSVGTATHYHTVWVVPYWQSSLTKITTVGAHIFYRWAGSWGAPAAFSAPYTGVELLPAKLAMAGNPEGDLGLMAAMGGMDSVDLDAYQPPQPTYGPKTAQIEAAQRAPLVADDVQGSLIADEHRGELLQN